MDKQQEQLETLREIRTMMERSSRFISLSGFSGVIAGVAAIAGVVAAYLYLGIGLGDAGYYKLGAGTDGTANASFFTFCLTDLFIVLIVSLVSASLLTMRKAKKQGIPIWDATAKRLLVNMLIPLTTGAIFCLILLDHGLLFLIAPATLIFYGLALVNASKYTLNDIRFLGICEVTTGLVASFYYEYGLLFWAFGFGILHMVYGISMYYKYER